jgi:hypothetical protein
MNVRMYSAAREATTKARNVASAIQQAQRQVNDDNKDISEKVDKNQQARDKKKAEGELFSAKVQKDLAQKQFGLTQKQQMVATIQAFVGLVGAAANIIQKINGDQKPKKPDTPDGKEPPKGGGGSGTPPKVAPPTGGGGGGGGSLPKVAPPSGGGGGGGGGSLPKVAPPSGGGGGGGGSLPKVAPPSGGGGGGGGGSLPKVPGGDLAQKVTGAVGDVASKVTGAVGDVAKKVTGAVGDVAKTVTGGGGEKLGDLKGLQKGAGFANQGAQKGLTGGGAEGSGKLSGAGDVVSKLQEKLGQALDKLGIKVPGLDSGGKAPSPTEGGDGKLAADGKFGDQTEKALKAFQSSQGLDPSGKVDDATIGKLESVLGSGPGDVAKDVVGGGLDVAKDVVGGGLDVAKDVVGGGLDVAKDVVGGGLDVAKDVVGGGLDVAKDVVGGGLDVAKDVVGGGLDVAKDVVGGPPSGKGDNPVSAPAGGPIPTNSPEGAGGAEGGGFLKKLVDFFKGGSTKEERAQSKQDMKALRELIEQLLQALGLNKATKGALGQIGGQLKSLGELVTTGKYNVRDENGEIKKDENGNAIQEEAGVIGKAIQKSIGEPLAKAGKLATQAVAGAIGSVVTAPLAGIAALTGQGGTQGKNDANAPGGGGAQGLEAAAAGLSDKNGVVTDASIAAFTQEAQKIFAGATTTDEQGGGERLLSGEEIQSKIGSIVQAAQQTGALAALKGAGVDVTGAKQNADGGLTLANGGTIGADLVKQLSSGGGVAQQALGQVQNALQQGNLSTGATLGATSSPVAAIATKAAPTGALETGGDPAAQLLSTLKGAGLDVTSEGGKLSLGGKEISEAQAGGLVELAKAGLDVSKAAVGENGGVSVELGPVGLSIGADGGSKLSVGGKEASIGAGQIGQLGSQVGQLAQLQGAGVSLAGLSTDDKGNLSLNIGGKNGASVGFGEDGKLSVTAGGQTQSLSVDGAKGALANLSTLANQGALSDSSGLLASISDGALQIGTTGDKGNSVNLGALDGASVQGLATAAGQGVSLAGATLGLSGEAGDGKTQSLSVNGAAIGDVAKNVTALSGSGVSAVGRTVGDGGNLSGVDAKAQSVIAALGAAANGATIDDKGNLNLANGAQIGKSAIDVLAGGIKDGKAEGTAKAVLGLAAQGTSIESLALGGLSNAGETGGPISLNGNINLDAKSVDALLGGGERGNAVGNAVKAASNLTSAVSTATGGTEKGSASISFDASKASGENSGIGLKFGGAGQEGSAVSGALVNSLANGGGKDAASGLSALANGLKGADGTSLLKDGQGSNFSAIAQVQAAGLQNVSLNSDGGITGQFAGKSDQNVNLDASAVKSLSIGTQKFGGAVTSRGENVVAGQVLAGLGKVKEQQDTGRNIGGANVAKEGKLSNISASPSTSSSSESTPAPSPNISSALAGVNLKGDSGSDGGKSLGSRVYGGLFGGVGQTAGELKDSFSGTSNPLVGLFTGDNKNSKQAKDVPGNLIDQSTDSIVKGIKGDAALKTAIEKGDFAGASSALAKEGFGAGDIAKILSPSRTSGGPLSLNSGELRKAVKGQLSVATDTDKEGNTNFAVNRNAGGAKSGQVGSLAISSAGRISGTGAVKAEGLDSGAFNNRRESVANAINGTLDKALSDEGRARPGFNSSGNINKGISAGDIQLDGEGNVASIRVGGKSLTLDQFAQQFASDKGLSSASGAALGGSLKGAVAGALQQSTADLQSGGSDNKLGAAVNQALASFKAAGTNTEGAKVSYGGDGKATITLADGKSIGVDEKGQLFAAQSSTEVGTGATSSRPGFGPQLTSASGPGQSGVIKGQDAALKGFLGEAQFEKFTKNQDAANTLAGDLNKAFDQSLFSGRKGGDAFGAALFGVLSLGLGSAANSVAKIGQKVSKVDFTYDEAGNVTGANVDFKNGNKLALDRNTQTGQYNVRNYDYSSGGLDNSRGLLNFLEAQRKDGGGEGRGNNGGVEGVFKGLGATGVSIQTSDNPNLPLSAPGQGRAAPDFNSKNDGFAQESLVSLELGGQKLDIGIDYDRKGGTFVNFDGLNSGQKEALRGGVQDKVARALAGDESLKGFVSSGDNVKAQARIDQILQDHGLGNVKLTVEQLSSGSTAPNGSPLKSAEELLNPRNASVTRALTQNLSTLVQSGDTKEAQARVDQTLKDSGLESVKLDVNEFLGTDGKVDSNKVSAALEKAGVGKAGEPAALQISTDDALGSVRSALGGSSSAPQVDEGERTRAERDILKSLNQSGLVNVRFASSALQNLVENKEFKAMVANGDTKGATALLRQAEKESGFNEGVFTLNDLTTNGADGKLQAKTADQLKQDFGSVDIQAGYDGRIADITTNNIQAAGKELAAVRAVENLVANDADFQALATGTAGSDVVAKYQAQLGEGFDKASQGEIAQEILNRSIKSAGVSPINAEGKAVVNLESLLKTESGKKGLIGSAGVASVLEQAGIKSSAQVGNISIHQDPSGRRSVNVEGGPAGLESNVNKNFSANEGPSKFKKTMDGVVKGLGESLPELMKALQALKKAMEDLQEAALKLAAAKKQYNAALKYAAEMGVTADIGGAGGGEGGGAGGVGALGMATNAIAAVAEAGKGGGAEEANGKGSGAEEANGKGGATDSVDENGNPTTPSEAVSELLSQVASDANFANIAVLLGLQPGMLIQQSQQADMLKELTQVIKQLQSPMGDPIQEMQRFLEQMHQRSGENPIPASDGIPFTG